MNITWTENVSKEDKKKILDKILEIESNEYHSFDEFESDADEHGAFSTIYFVGDYALKFTSFWEYDELLLVEDSVKDLFGESSACFPILQSDHEIIKLIKNHPSCVKMYGFSSNWVILEKISGYSLQDEFILNNNKVILNNSQKEQLLNFIFFCLQKRVIPFDINRGSIFLDKTSNLKIIDFNMYQKVDELFEDSFVFNDEKNLFDIANKILYNLDFII